MSREVVILREAEVRAVLDMASCIDAMEHAFSAYSSGRAELPSVIHLDVPESEGEIHVKAGHIHGEPYYAVKVASGFGANAELGLPVNDGLVVVFDAHSGSPAAFLLDRGFITDQRTGAAGGVAARHLAPAAPNVVAMIGTGTQPRYQLEALASERSFTEVRVWGRHAERASACSEMLAAQAFLPDGCTVTTTGSVREAVEGADVVITATASREPLVFPDWIVPGTHVTALGSDGSGKQELDPAVLGRADLVVVDSRDQCSRIGELHHAIEAGVISEMEVVELGEITGGLRSGRESEDQVTVCDLTGVGVQDVAAAALAIQRAGDAGERLTL